MQELYQIDSKKLQDDINYKIINRISIFHLLSHAKMCDYFKLTRDMFVQEHRRNMYLDLLIDFYL